ncbi:MAG: hypothetical protein IAG13_06350 [Deltaproteobacteria bacterium]|nr:hypothetical protein [Nannocystaceae bacterium]
MRRILKFLHEVGSAGLIGALVAQAILSFYAESLDVIGHATVRQAMLMISGWLLMPSLLLVVMSGLIAIAVHDPFKNAGWVWLKAISTVLMLEGTLLAVHGPAQAGAEVADAIARGDTSEAALLGPIMVHERGGIATIMVVSLANIVVAIWRPRFRRRGAATQPA